MRRLHSAPKPSPRVLRYISDERLRVGRAEGVAHAIVSRQVGAGFRGGDDVIAGDGVIGGGQADLADFAAQALGTRPRPR